MPNALRFIDDSSSGRLDDIAEQIHRSRNTVEGLAQFGNGLNRVAGRVSEAQTADELADAVGINALSEGIDRRVQDIVSAGDPRAALKNLRLSVLDRSNLNVVNDIEAFSKVRDRTLPFLDQQTPSGWVMMMLGRYMFSLTNAAYQNLSRTSQYRWPAEQRIGRRPALQFVGAGQDSINLSGAIYPNYAGGLRQIDAMRDMAGKGEPLILIDALGINYQQWCILRIKETARILLQNGAPRRVDFEMELSRYGRDKVEQGE